MSGLGDAVWDDTDSGGTQPTEGVFAARVGGISTPSGGSGVADPGSVSAGDLDAASGASDWSHHGGGSQCPDGIEDHAEPGRNGAGLSPTVFAR